MTKQMDRGCGQRHRGRIFGDTAAAEETPGKPKLVVLISIDQFSADLVQREPEPNFGTGSPGGAGHRLFERFSCAGRDRNLRGPCGDCGGRHPAATGIIANQWYDQRAGVDRYCTDDGIHVAARASRKLGTGPGMLEVSTLGDWLKAASPANRVFSVAGKDRSAIMMGGRHPTGRSGSMASRDSTHGAPIAGRAAPPRAACKAQCRVARRLEAHPPGPYRRESCRLREAVIPLPAAEFPRASTPDPPAAIPGQPPASGAALLPPRFYDQITIDAAIDLLDGQKLGQSSEPTCSRSACRRPIWSAMPMARRGPDVRPDGPVDEEVGRLLKRIAKLRFPSSSRSPPTVAAAISPNG